MEPKQIVQAAIDAYHDHDLDRCLSYYALDYDILNRISLGAFVVDEERVTGFTKPGSPGEVRAVLIYRFSGRADPGDHDPDVNSRPAGGQTILRMSGDCLVNGRVTWAATLDAHSACARLPNVKGFYALREHETARL